MAFSDQIRNIAHYPAQMTAQGIFPPLIRVTTHLTHVLDDLINGRGWSDEDRAQELQAIRTHTNAIKIDSPTLSDGANEHLTILAGLIHAYTTEFPGWTSAANEADPNEAQRHTQEVLDRIAAVATMLDRELAALQSDAGRDI